MRVSVVLLRHVKNLGPVGAVCSVKRGYLGFLLRENMAMRATKDNLAYCERERTRLEASNQALYDEAVGVKADLDQVFLHFIRSAGETGHLYGSIGVRDVIDALSEKNVKGIKASMVGLPKFIKTTGVHTCTLQLHPDVVMDLGLVVAKTPDEAVHLETEAKTPTVDASAQEPVHDKAAASEMEETSENDAWEAPEPDSVKADAPADAS